jgi:23S rRNA (adenine2503-C2)-methyltransferase
MTENILRGLELPEGYSVETVYYGSGTLCISSQAGCRMACPFCASGSAGLVRNLSAEEMHAQVALNSDNDVKRITISGIGEPLDNLKAVKQFIEECGLPVSVTTSVPNTEKLKTLITGKHNGVMLSIHSGMEETHKQLVPNAADLDAIFSALSDIWPELSVNKRKKIGFNYMLLKGVNDRVDEVRAMAERVENFKEATVHLLAYNDVEGSCFKSSEVCRFVGIYEWMRSRGINVRRANTWRKSENGGCGTLFLKTVQK